MKQNPKQQEIKKAVIPQKPPKGPPKQFQQDGHWIVNPTKTHVLVCACGNRYLKTRPNQTVCLRCMAFGARR